MIVEAIERNVSKLGFDACLRFVYIAKPINTSCGFNAIQGSMKQFTLLNMNGFSRTNSTSYVDYFFKNKRERRLEERKNV